jgi:hypothetical protein
VIVRPNFAASIEDFVRNYLFLMPKSGGYGDIRAAR